jgi:hypothetical protein
MKTERNMIRRLDKLWFGVLGRAQRWLLRRVAAHFRRKMGREAEAHRRQEAVQRLERHLASQKPHLN